MAEKPFAQQRLPAIAPRRRVLMALGYYDPQLQRGITRYARDAGWVLDASMAHYGVIPTHWRGDGIITILIPGRKDISRYVRRREVPAVALYGDARRINVPRVLLDDARIGQLAAEHLLERGFSDLGFCKFSGLRAVLEREKGFRDTVCQAGKTYHLLDWDEDSKHKNWFDWFKRQLLSLPFPIGMMAQSDHRAAYLISACEALGVAVPEEVAVIGVDNDVQTCELALVPISSVDSNRETMAYEGAALLDRLMDGERRPRDPIVVPAKGVVVRHSSDFFAVPHPPLARALHFIRDHFSEPLGVDDVIRASQTSRCGLYRAFEKHLGHTVGEEIDRQRVGHAKKLLRESNDKLHRIASISGFSGPEHFTRVFRRVMGEPPSSYRNRLRGEHRPH
ncbi:MAG: DNA-binding transcriptional regulator [Pirellulaceae bacterium]